MVKRLYNIEILSYIDFIMDNGPSPVRAQFVTARVSCDLDQLCVILHGSDAECARKSEEPLKYLSFATAEVITKMCILQAFISLPL